MSLSAMTWALDLDIKRPTAKLALVCLADHADEEGTCFPSQKALADRVGVTPRAIRDALAWLESEGIIRRQKRFRKDGSRTSDAYQLSLPDPRKKLPIPRNETQGQPEESSGLTTFEPPTEPVTVAERAMRPLDDLQEKLFQAAGLSDPRSERNPGLIVLAPILGLLDAGYDLDADILPVIRSKAAAGVKPRSWGFYVEAIRDAVGRRSAAAATARPSSAPADPGAVRTLMKPETFDEARWRSVLEYARPRSEWQDIYGPPPWAEGCLVPRDLWQERDRERFGVGVAA